MKKLLLLALVVASATCNAEVLQCSTQTMKMDGKVIMANVPMHDTYINITKEVITISVSDLSIQFWKDYNEYRNDTGRLLLDKMHNNFIMETSIKDESTGNFVPTVIVYKCN